MKRLILLVGICLLLVGDVSADAFSAWSNYGDAWKATNDTTTLIMWNGTGSYTWLSTGNTTSVAYLVVAGGGGGGTGDAAGGGGGGGAGGFLVGTNGSISGSIPVNVGTGGTAGVNGTNSTFGNIAAMGGGAGGPTSGAAGRMGGSGGGGSNIGGAAGAGVSGQGYNGGITGSGHGGGGGGSASVGLNGGALGGGAMGNGTFSSITGSSVCYAEGGSAGFGTYSGLCGGGRGGTSTAAIAAINGTGSGGGGNYNSKGASAGGSGIVIISYLTPSSQVNISFIQSPNPSTSGQSVDFIDNSTGSPTTWNWSINGANTNTTQNMSYTFTTFGTYYVDLNVTNSTGMFSNYTAMHNVTNVTGFTPEDIWMEGEYLQTFHITDSATGLPIPVVDLQDTAMQTYVTTNGTGYLTEPFGASTVVFISTGYSSKAVSYFFDSAENHSVQLTASSNPLPISIPGTAKDVKFHIQSFWGNPVYNANVSVQGITTTTGNWDWLALLSSIDLDSTPINSTEMTGLTDTNGDVVFLMLDSIKYNISVTASGYTFPLTIISPQASQYTISANMNDTWFSSGNDTLKEVNVSVSWVTINSTHSFVNISYDDQTATTTGGNIRVYREAANRVANATPIAIMNITASTCSNSTKVDTPTGGASYRVDVNATTTSGDHIVRTFTHFFKGAPVSLPGWTSETLLWLALFIVIFTAAFAGVLHAPQMSIIICVEAWVFWAIGWLDALISQFWYGETAILGVLTLATFITIVWNITEGKAKGKRSS